ncbi:phage baseplate assembly protein V [Nocardioides sp. YIM 152315]|uniref:phage baseplate assembly protein V n=1 Tax=Nocardioides sp. YIM 152315 TaxID=3031760 RepID=UPI0023D9A4C0|nr:phage baseplate assembly protein V [Nocardioides sp. YIM 152315]
MSTISVAPKIEINGQPASAAMLDGLVSVSVDRGVNLVGRATLRFLEAGFTLTSLPSFDVGTAVTIKPPSGPALFSGEVTGVSVDQELTSAGPTTELSVTVDDKAYRLGQATKNRSFLQQKYSDVITTLASEAGLTSSRVTETGEVHPYLLQAGTSLAYLDWMTARCGMVWYVDGNDLHVVKAGTSSGTVSLTLGTNLVRFSARASALNPARVSVTGWDESQQAAVTGEAATPNEPESTFVSKYPGRSRSATGSVAVAALTPHTQAEATDLGESLLAQSASAAVVARGTCFVDHRIVPCSTVEVANTGATAGGYVVTRVEHVYDSTGFHTHFTAGPIRPSDLVDLLGAPATSPGPVMGALVSAQVTNVSDPDTLGRAKVKFTSMGGDVESWWARIVTLGGGDQRGLVFQPEVGDEVLVGFEQGDTRRPLILGGLFSSQKTLPTTGVQPFVDNGAIKYRRITSRLGHLVELADGQSPSESHILIRNKVTGNLIRLGEDRLDVSMDGKPIKLDNGAGATIELAANGDVTIEGANVSIKATSGAVKVDGATDVQLKASVNLKAEGAIVGVKAQGSATVEASGPLALKGALVAIN